jgi:hypothetical protein
VSPSLSARCQSVALALALFVSFALISTRIFERSPFGDEALVAVPAWNLAQHGYAGNSVIKLQTLPWKGIDRHTYSTLPGGILYLALWLTVFPATILVTRLAFLLWSLVLLAGCFQFLRRLTASRTQATLAVILFSLHFSFILAASKSRVDVMAAALGMASLASYVELRARNLKLAALAASALAVAACLTHPQGVLYAVCLTILAVHLDRCSFSAIHYALAAVPLAVCGAVWLWYVAQDPAAAFSQLILDTHGRQGRFPRSFNPWYAFWREIFQRYLYRDAAARGTRVGKLILLLITSGSAAVIMFTTRLKRQPGVCLLLFLSAAILTLETLLENSKERTYLIHAQLFYSALIAVCVVHFWQAGRWRRWLSVLTTTTYIAISVGGIVVRLNADFNELSESGFRSALAFLQTHVSPRDLVSADETFWFDCCGAAHNLVDDPELGVTTGLTPEYFVNSFNMSNYRIEDPALLRSVQERAGQFQLIYDYAGYQIYRRR